MIFKTINSSIDSSRKSIALFNKDWNTYVTNFKNASGLKGKAISIISSNDINCLRAYNQQISNGIKPSQAYRNTMTSCTKEAKQQAVAIAKGTVTIDKATESIKKSTLAATANKIAMSAMSIALNIGTFMLISAAVSKVISVFNELVHSEENLRQSANELGSELSNNSSDIDGYKKKIDELKAVINDSSSSFGEVSQARVDLMTIQDELIEKFGTEKGVIESITSAINDQTDALDELSRRSYYQAKNKFNEKTGGDKFADWLSFGNTDDDRIQSNMDKMVAEMRYSAYELETTGNEILDNLIAKSYGLNIFNDMYGDGKHFQVIGTLDEIQGKLYGIQELSQGFDLSTGFENSFTEISNDVDDALSKYRNLYDQYVLYEKILTDTPDNQYDEQFDLINKAKEEYNKAIQSGNEENIKSYAEEYAKTLQSAIDLATNNYDYDVADYYKNMYPELQQIFGEWQFNLNFEPNTDGLKDKVTNALDTIDGVSDGITSFSVEDINNFNPNIVTPEQIDAYGELTNVAKSYGLTIQQLITLLQTLGLVQSESYQQLVDTFGQENVDKLSPEDLEISYTIENAGNMTFNELQAEIEKSKEIADESLPFSTRFQNLWNSESFSDAQKDLAKLSKESGITANDILSLAKENEELASLLDESGISAQFAATCFQRVCNGANGFSAITDDAIALDQVLHEMDDRLQSVAVSKSAYDKAMGQNDYNAEFKNYQEAYKSAMEMFENGDYGKHFRSAMEYLLGDDSYTMSIEEMKNAMDGLKNVFGENATNGLEFLDILYEKKDILDGMDSSLKKLSDGSYDFDLKPEEFEKIGQAVGMTADEVAACTSALGMFGDYKSYDIEKLEDTLKGMSIAAGEGRESILSLQGVQSILSNLGYDGYEIYSIMQDIQGISDIRLIDFNADDENSLKSVVGYLKELNMIEIDGKSINADALINNLRDSFSMASVDIEAFIKNLSDNCGYSFEDAEGKALSLTEAIEKVQTSENDAAAESIDGVGESAENATDKVEELNGQKTTGIRGEFELLANKILDVSGKITDVIQQMDTLDGKKLPSLTDTGTGNQGSAKSTVTGSTGKGFKDAADKITGEAKASGSIGLPNDETALVNELGNETIIDPKSGTYEIIEGGAQFRKLKKGQIILNHLQTKALLAKGKISSFGKMMFGGNASFKGKSYASGTAGGINPATGKNYGNNNKNKSKDSTSDKSKEDTKKEFSELFDWIERRIKKFQTSFDKWIKQAETAVTSGYVDKYYKKAASSARNQLSTYGKAYNRYMAEANAVGLDEQYAKKVRNGTIDIEAIRAEGTEEEIKQYEELADKIKEYQDWYDKAQDSMDSFTEAAEKLANIPLDKAARKAELFSNAVDLLGKRMDNAISAKTKNKLVDRQTKEEKKTLNAHKSAQKETGKQLKAARRELRKSRNLDADDGITAKEKKKIQKAMRKGNEADLSFFREGSAGYKAAVRYNEALKANRKATDEAKAAQQDYSRWLVEAAKMKFDNITDKYEKKLQLIGYEMSALDNKVAEIEAAGKKVDKAYYESQKKVNASTLAKYKAEKAALEESIKGIKKGTDEWYDAKDAIQQVEDAISGCVEEAYDLNNAINQLHFDLFGDVSDSIKRIVTEQEFLQGLFAHEKNADNETGNLTEAGIAKLGSLSASYHASKSNAERDASEVAELQRMFDSGSLHSDLLGITFNSLDDLKAKLDETYTKWQDDIGETYRLEASISDLMKEKYQAELDMLKELIDAKTEALNAEKDLHDYQKTLNEKAESISTIQKQIAAYSGDTSQEGMARLQKLQKELADREEDLRETEYDRYISDQEEMLGKLYNEYEELMGKKLDDFMSLVSEGLQTAEENTSIISSYLGKVASDNGYTEETEGLFSGISASISGNVDRVIAAMSSDVSSRSGTDAGNAQPGGSASQTPGKGGTAVSKGNTSSQKQDKTDWKGSVRDFIRGNAVKADKKKSEYGDVNKAVYDNKGKLYQGKGKVLPSKALKELAKLIGIKYTGDNSKDGAFYKKLKTLKIPGFKKGGVVSVDDIEEQVRENGDTSLVSVQSGEGILTKEETKAVRKLADNAEEPNKTIMINGAECTLVSQEDLLKSFIDMSHPGMDTANVDILSAIKNFMPDFSNMPKNNMPDIPPVTNNSHSNVVNIDNITLPNVKNYSEFKNQMLHDIQAEKKAGNVFHGVAGVSQMSDGRKLNRTERGF